jgi:hypothetical protein
MQNTKISQNIIRNENLGQNLNLPRLVLLHYDHPLLSKSSSPFPYSFELTSSICSLIYLRLCYFQFVHLPYVAQFMVSIFSQTNILAIPKEIDLEDGRHGFGWITIHKG